MNESDIARQLLACAARAANSEQKRTHFIDLPSLVLGLARDIATGHYQPQPFTVFAVTEPKLREIFAPAFADRLVQQWLVSHVEPWWDRRFIDDSFANRQGKGTQAAVRRLQHFMRQTGQRWYCHLDIRAFFPSIDRTVLLQLWRKAQPHLPWPQTVRTRLDQVATAIITQDPTQPAPLRSGDTALLARIPAHKRCWARRLAWACPLAATPASSLPTSTSTSWTSL